MKERILERRARFVALALAGCQPSVAPVNAIDLPPSGDASMTAQVVDASTASVDEDAAKPGADIPSGISDETRLRYQRAKEHAATLRSQIAALGNRIQAAPTHATPSGKATWMDIIGTSEALHRSIGYMSVYCPKKRPETDAFLAWVSAEAERLRAEVDALETKSQARLGDQTMNGKTRWDAFSAEYNRTHPMPCLSMSCDSW